MKDGIWEVLKVPIPLANSIQQDFGDKNRNKLDKEVIQNTKYTEKNEGITSESNCIDIFKSVDNEIVDQLIRSRRKHFPKNEKDCTKV